MTCVDLYTKCLSENEDVEMLWVWNREVNTECTNVSEAVQ